MTTPIDNRAGEHKLIAITSIDPNPYRWLERYPLEADRTEALRVSMTETGAWPRLMVRKVGRRYEQAFGHHQIAVMREAGSKKIDCFVTDIPEDEMIRLLALENGDGTMSSGMHNKNAVDAARTYLEATYLGDPKKDDFRADAEIPFFGKPDAAHNGCTKSSEFTIGAGPEAITKFLQGMKPTAIRNALAQLGQSEWQKARIAHLTPVWEATRAEQTATAKAQADREATAKAKEAKALATQRQADAAVNTAKTKAAKEAAAKKQAAAKVKADAAALERQRAAKAQKNAKDAAEKTAKDAKAAAEKVAKDAEWDSSSTDVFASPTHGKVFREACMKGYPDNHVPRDKQKQWAKWITDVCVAARITDGHNHGAEHAWPQMRLKSETITAYISERQAMIEVGPDLYWKLRKADWRADLVKLFRRAKAGTGTTIKLAELEDLIHDFYIQYSVVDPNGHFDLVKNGTSIIDGMSGSDFATYWQGVDAKRSNAARFQSDLEAKATKERDRILKGIADAKAGLVAMYKIANDNPGFTFPTGDIHEGIKGNQFHLDELDKSMNNIRVVNG